MPYYGEMKAGQAAAPTPPPNQTPGTTPRQYAQNNPTGIEPASATNTMDFTYIDPKHPEKGQSAVQVASSGNPPRYGAITEIAYKGPETTTRATLDRNGEPVVTTEYNSVGDKNADRTAPTGSQEIKNLQSAIEAEKAGIHDKPPFSTTETSMDSMQDNLKKGRVTLATHDQFEGVLAAQEKRAERTVLPPAPATKSHSLGMQP